MGLMPPPINCHLTELNTEHYSSELDLIEYTIQIGEKRMMFRFNYAHQNSYYVESNKYILYGLILNDTFPTEYGNINSPVLDNDKLEHIIKQAVIPRSPEDKMANLLDYLYSLQSYEGAVIKYADNEDKEIRAKKLYFRNYDEMDFYLSTLNHQGLIDVADSSSKHGNTLTSIRLTFNGLAKVIEVNESGFKSNRCFVAMSFSHELKETRDTIKNGIIEAGFRPILIDEVHIDADITINDAIISEIKKCKFLVADFTQHKHGVYFETGFALGLKRPVIYLCHKDDFENTHFDTNHYPHIIYENLNELKLRLKTKIEAWIK
jgi:nucleoside 2-deoxyribosyltransferase